MLRRFALALTLLLLVSVAAAPKPAASEDGIDVYFSPNGGAGQAIVREIKGAKSSLDIAAYTYTHTEIAKATMEAHKRGVKVRVVRDKLQANGKYTSATFLHNAGIPVRIDSKAGLMHNKYLVIDGKMTFPTIFWRAQVPFSSVSIPTFPG